MEKIPQVYEACLKGFDGSTDATDHLVKWIVAYDAKSAREHLEQLGYDIQSFNSTELPVWADGVDYWHPKVRDYMSSIE